MDMAPLNHMPEPLCLIENTNGRLLVNLKALKILSAIRQPVVVVAIVGPYRTGKSYLMNKLAGKKKGFSVGSTVQCSTKGIWMWCVPHPKKPNHTLVLLDTEGLGDIEKGDKTNDTHIFVLALLLSSTFVYNTMNKIDHGAINLLHYVTELSQLLRIDTSPALNGVNDAADFVRVCPDLVWTLRDFYLDLEANGQLITADEYLENSLRPKQDLKNIVQTYVNAINSGDLPCMENEVLTLAQIKNSAVVQKAIAHYDQQMGQKLQLPTETHQELLDLHRASEKEAIEVFMKNSFKDEDQGYWKKLEMQLVAKLNYFHKRNLEASQNRCSALLQDIFHPLEENVKQGVYAKPGGHCLFIQKREELKEKYNQEPGKGIQAEEALQKYLESKESVSVTILQTDLALTASEKEIEGLREEFMKAEAQRLMESLTQHQQMMEPRKIVHQEQVRLMETNRVYQEALQQRAMERQLQEEVKRLKERFQAENRQLHNELQNLLRNDSPDDTCILL
ncbi:hypothetical protein G4228_012997 [Cervus hanglu yarkandensis]|nr:hypothetical protein G4228_012997 [Cervus hanglu yarkandensis]